jgi:predicted AlkP superfamily phosphohydrolase/phosphomutase
MTAPTKVLFICLDAAERDLLLEWADAGDLPNIQALRQRSLWADAPALPGLGSGALWPSFCTGVNPSRHGRYFSLHMQIGTYELHKYRFDKDQWRPFWRTLSQAGRRVAVIDVPYDSLCDDINGLQIVDWVIHNPQRSEAGIWPPEEAKNVAEHIGAEDPVGMCDHYSSSGADMEAFKKRLLAQIARKGDLACQYLDQGGWDLFLMTFDESHCAGHRAWHLHDTHHPRHDPEMASKVGDPVKDVYVAIDAQIGRLLDLAGPDTTVILLSGTGMGPNFSCNHLLDEVLGRLENNRPSIGRIALRPARLIWSKILPPHIRAQLRSKVVHVEQSLIASDRKRRKAFTVPHNDISGAIRINLVGREPNGRVRPGPEADAFCAQLTRDLMELRNLDTGAPMVKRVVRTADLYKGEHVGDFADLFVVWNKSGTVNSVGSPKIGTISRSFTGTRTGDHTPNGLFMAYTPGLTAGRRDEPISILDLAPTVASLLDITLNDVEGTPIEDICSVMPPTELVLPTAVPLNAELLASASLGRERTRGSAETGWTADGQRALSLRGGTPKDCLYRAMVVALESLGHEPVPVPTHAISCKISCHRH